MPPTLTCKSSSTHHHSFSSSNLGGILEHLRREHQPYNIKRPNPLGVSDAHGHLWGCSSGVRDSDGNLWYCFACTGAYGKDHKSFGSDHATWSHLQQCHGHWLKDIVS